MSELMRMHTVNWLFSWMAYFRGRANAAGDIWRDNGWKVPSAEWTEMGKARSAMEELLRLADERSRV